MNGILLEDRSVLSAMEPNLAGVFIPVKTKKDGSFDARSSLASLEQMGLIRREVDGKSREQRFVDYCLEFYRQFDKGLYTLDDIRAVLKDECDIEIDMQ